MLKVNKEYLIDETGKRKAVVIPLSEWQQIIEELESDLAKITGLPVVSLQPNSGAQGEFTGLMVIRTYHHSKGEIERNVVLIPSSAHGTNPASAVMAGMKVVVVKCDNLGNIDVDDLKSKAESYKDNLSALMVTYPSTHGVFEEKIVQICDIIHENGRVDVGIKNICSSPLGIDACC